VIDRFFKHRFRTCFLRGIVSGQPSSKHAQNLAEAIAQAIGAFDRKPYPGGLSGRLHQLLLQYPLEKPPRLYRSEAKTKQSIPRTQAPCFAASAFLWATTNPSRPNPLIVGVIDPSLDKPMPSERSARSTARTTHKEQFIQKCVDLPSICEETNHPPIIHYRHKRPTSSGAE